MKWYYCSKQPFKRSHINSLEICNAPKVTITVVTFWFEADLRLWEFGGLFLRSLQKFSILCTFRRGLQDALEDERKIIAVDARNVLKIVKTLSCHIWGKLMMRIVQKKGSSPFFKMRSFNYVCRENCCKDSKLDFEQCWNQNLSFD